MNEHPGISTDWEVEIDHAFLAKNLDRGTFSLLNGGEIVLAYNPKDDTGLHESGRLARIAGGVVADILETPLTLWAPVVDDTGDIYVSTIGVYHADTCRGDPSTLFKVKPDNTVAWEHRFEGTIDSLPAIQGDSVFIYDYVDRQRGGHLNKLSKDGEVLWAKPFRAFIAADLLALRDSRRVLVGLRSLKDQSLGSLHLSEVVSRLLRGEEDIAVGSPAMGVLLLLDTDGNMVLKKMVGDAVGPGWDPDVFCQSPEGIIYGSVHGTFVALDRELNVIWSYKPEIGWVCDAPAVDGAGNLYCKLTGKRLVSLDPEGGIRWTAETSGHMGHKPLVLKNGNVLSTTAGRNGKRAGQEQTSTYLEVFSPQGKKLLSHEMLGNVFHACEGAGNSVFVALNLSRIIVGKERIRNSVRVCSLRLS